MPRRRSGTRGRVTRRNSNPRLPLDEFDDEWLREYSERQFSEYIDLTKYEDRRRWHPSKLRGIPPGPALAGRITKPRVVVVPEGHRLARLAPYGGRVPLSSVLSREKRTRRRSLDYFTEKTYRGPHGTYHSFGPDHLSRRVGFQHPWQVMICVRRRIRREVIFALNKGGKGKAHKHHYRRNEHSEIRC